MRLFLISALLCLAPLAQADYSNHAKTAELLEVLKAEFGFSKAELQQARATLQQAQKVPKLIEAEKNAKEKTLTWTRYRPIHVNPKNIQRGAAFYHEHRGWFEKAEQRFGVSRWVIAAIMGVETKYGGYTGPHRVLDSLATQGFDHPTRSRFFFRELTEFLVLCRDKGFNPTELVGSYAGAMGMAQFMPSNYRKLALDFDEDGDVDLWSIPDAIGSIAHYLINYRPSASWQTGEATTVPAVVSQRPKDLKLNGRNVDTTVAELSRHGVEAAMPLAGDSRVGLVELNLDKGYEYWLGLPNFYSIMAYNPRVFYAMSVAQLASAIEVAATH